MHNCCFKPFFSLFFGGFGGRLLFPNSYGPCYGNLLSPYGFSLVMAYLLFLPHMHKGHSTFLLFHDRSYLKFVVLLHDSPHRVHQKDSTLGETAPPLYYIILRRQKNHFTHPAAILTVENAVFPCFQYFQCFSLPLTNFNFI